MTFVAGHPKYGGKQAGALRIGDIIAGVPVAKKRELVLKAYELAIDGDFRWAEWLVKHSGESNFAAESTNSTLALLMLWQQWQLTPEQQARVLERLTPETRAQLAPVFEGEVLQVVSSVISDDAESAVADGSAIQRPDVGADGEL